jgi:non-specific serine/threonine protein kinase/serine/threonine-protein kinase
MKNDGKLSAENAKRTPLAGALNEDSQDLQLTISVADASPDYVAGTSFLRTASPIRQDSIGEYKIINLLGEGGMGIVWEAEQKNPRRRVALKVMRQGHRVDELHAKMFHHEAQTLGRLRHSHIAAIYESGHTAEGQDFFAMELVQGDTLDVWLQTRPSSLDREELKLRLLMFTRLCEAVHYAHQRGVIHRDLKPKNVIVTDDSNGSSSGSPQSLPVMKILDFGLARITDVDAQTVTMMSEVGAIRGTLPYMSPEQARGDAQSIDLRTDVYALGVILYEMLTLKRPIDLEARSLVDAVRLICNSPPRPLRAAWRGSFRLDPDLETIVSKALGKEPDERYSSATALADDVGRFLASEPIEARRPSPAYRVKKFVGRNRLAVTTSAVVTLALLAGFVGTASGLIRVKRAELSARQQAASSDRVSQFIADMLASVDPHQVGVSLLSDLEEQVAEASKQAGRSSAQVERDVEQMRRTLRGVSATETGRKLVGEAVLSRAGDAISERFGEEPGIAGRLEHTLAATYERLGLYDTALSHAQRAVAAHQDASGFESRPTLRSQSLLGLLKYRKGSFQEADTLLKETLEIQRQSLPVDDLDTALTARTLSWVYLEQGRAQDAEQLLLPTIDQQRRVLGERHAETMTSLNTLAVALMNQEKYAEAEEMHARVLAARSEELGPTHQDTLKSMTNLAVVSFYQNRLEDAEALFREVLDIQRETLGPAHPTTLGSANNLAVICERMGLYAESEQLHREAFEVKRQVLGPNHPETLSSAYNLAVLETAQGELGEAEKLHSATLQSRRETLGEHNPATLDSWTALAGVAALAGRRDLAIARLQKAIEAGFDDASTLMTDSDFVSLRGDKEFLAIVDAARDNKDQK